MTKPKKWLYQIQYTDNTYRMVEWTTAEFDKFVKLMCSDKHIIVIGGDMFSTKDIRAIVKMKVDEPKTVEVDGEQQPIESEEHPLAEYGFADQETLEYLKAIGIDVVNGGMKE